MAIYSLAVNTTVGTTGIAIVDIKTGPNTRARLMELAIATNANTASTWRLERSANGPTRTGPTALLAEDPASPAAQTDMATAWTTAPTSPGVYLRYITVGAGIGTGVIWTFPRGLPIITPPQVLAVFNGSTSSANVNTWAVVDE